MMQHEDKPESGHGRAATAAQAWQFVRPGEVSEASAVAVEEEPVSAFQFVRFQQQPADSPAPDYSASSEEFSKIIDKKMAARRRRNRRSFMVTMIFLVGTTLGSAGWFVSNPDRVTAFKAAVSDIRSATDINAMRAKYQKSLDKIGERRNHINDATAMMGIDPDKPVAGDDPYMDKEMKQIIGEDGGPTVGDRNRKLAAKVEELKKTGVIQGETPDPAANPGR